MSGILQQVLSFHRDPYGDLKTQFPATGLTDLKCDSMPLPLRDPETDSGGESMRRARWLKRSETDHSNTKTVKRFNMFQSCHIKVYQVSMQADQRSTLSFLSHVPPL